MINQRVRRIDKLLVDFQMLISSGVFEEYGLPADVHIQAQTSGAERRWLHLPLRCAPCRTGYPMGSGPHHSNTRASPHTRRGRAAIPRRCLFGTASKTVCSRACLVSRGRFPRRGHRKRAPCQRLGCGPPKCFGDHHPGREEFKDSSALAKRAIARGTQRVYPIRERRIHRNEPMALPKCAPSSVACHG